MKRWMRYALAAAAAAGLGYAAWSRSGRKPPEEPMELALREVRSFGEDTGAGNLLGLQPYMVPADYASEERLRGKLDGYLAAARERGFLTEKTVVVLPEYLGTWLVVAREKASVYRAETTDEATLTVALSNLPGFVGRLRFTDSATRKALFQMKARSMAAIYNRVFSQLAREYAVTIVAGSILLPNPRVEGGSVVIGRGPLYNVSAVYGPDGRARTPVVRKAFLIEEEKPFLSAGAVEALPVFDTPAGRLGVLVCADAWYPESYQVLRKKGAEVIAVPSFLRPDNAWERPWSGAKAAPGEVITEGEAWMRYALAGRMKESAARAGINVFLRGKLWDLGSDGQATGVLGDEVYTCPRVDGAVMMNLWLTPKGEEKQRK